MGLPDGMNKKPPARITVAVESKILASREEAAQMLSISQRALDYLIATRRLPTRRIVAGFSFRSRSYESMRVPTIQSGLWLRLFSRMGVIGCAFGYRKWV
jgi:hypothetical protein